MLLAGVSSDVGRAAPHARTQRRRRAACYRNRRCRRRRRRRPYRLRPFWLLILRRRWRSGGRRRRSSGGRSDAGSCRLAPPLSLRCSRGSSLHRCATGARRRPGGRRVIFFTSRFRAPLQCRAAKLAHLLALLPHDGERCDHRRRGRSTSPIGAGQLRRCRCRCRCRRRRRRRGVRRREVHPLPGQHRHRRRARRGQVAEDRRLGGAGGGVCVVERARLRCPRTVWRLRCPRTVHRCCRHHRSGSRSGGIGSGGGASRGKNGTLALTRSSSSTTASSTASSSSNNSSSSSSSSSSRRGCCHSVARGTITARIGAAGRALVCNGGILSGRGGCRLRCRLFRGAGGGLCRLLRRRRLRRRRLSRLLRLLPLQHALLGNGRRLLTRKTRELVRSLCSSLRVRRELFWCLLHLDFRMTRQRCAKKLSAKISSSAPAGDGHGSATNARAPGP